MYIKACQYKNKLALAGRFVVWYWKFEIKMLNKIAFVSLIILIFLTPNFVSALGMPQSGNDLANMVGINAKAYIVKDLTTGEVLISKNETLPWVPASLTKLVTALVVLDAKVKLNKVVSITSADQKSGYCGSGGACIKAKAGVKFTVDSLFHAMLLPSANNAAFALVRSTGLTQQQFAQKMNEKVVSLGAKNSKFVEPSGISSENIITAEDYTKIVEAAFKHPYLRKIAGMNSYFLRSTNNSRYNQTIKNTDKLLSDSEIKVIGAKTGYIDESKYNFGAFVNYAGGHDLAVVVLGEDHLYSAFAETKQLVKLAELANAIGFINHGPLVLGASTKP